MEVKTASVGPLASNCYVVAAGDRAVVIDPGAEVNRIRAALAGFPVAAVFITHGHSDHVGAVEALLATTGAPLIVPAADLELVKEYVAAEPDRLVAGGERFEFGEILLEVIATPGHTPGSSCFYAPGVLFSGDTLFAGGVGRTDLRGGSTEALGRSIRERLLVLPEDTVVYPGHGALTSIGEERRSNPFVASAFL